MNTDTYTRDLRQGAYAVLREQGYSISQASAATAYTREHASKAIESKRKKGYLSSLRPKAKKAIDITLRGEAIGRAMPPRASDVLRAAEIVLDRTDPIVTRHEVSQEVTITTCDLSAYAMQAPDIIDVSVAGPEQLPSPETDIA